VKAGPVLRGRASSFEGGRELVSVDPTARPEPDPGRRTGLERTPEVLALIGPAGTGKSHRASIVAEEMDADAILDDGLLIAGGKILAGRSAKRESTRVAAVRRALLDEPTHAAEVREALDRLGPSRLLVIGISEEMVRRALANIGLPPPSRVMSIEEFASPRQMRKAVRIRRTEGKHVIPAPTLEVRKSFAGYPVDPLRVFLKAKARKRAPGRFVEKSVVRPTWSALGRFYIEDVVLAAIAGRAAVETAGVARVYRVRVDADEAGVSFELSLGVVYGHVIRETAAAVRRRVTEVVEHMTALTCRKVDVIVTRILPTVSGEGRLWNEGINTTR